MKTIKTLNKLDVCDRVGNVADRVQTVCLLLSSVDYLESTSDNVSVYSKPNDIRGDLVNLCVSELLSAADVLNTLHENCREYEVENHETD